MKSNYVNFSFIGIFAFLSLGLSAQEDSSPVIQNYRMPGYDGVNVFETKKDDTPFKGMKVRVGGDFALQLQAINHENWFDKTGHAGVPELINLGSNFNLPTANLNLDVQLVDGLRMHLRTYLSSRHHTETYVKGGYLQMDNLNFVNEGLLRGLMDFTSIRIGMDEINYGDTHFRRSDNASAFYNPFVGNYIMDAFTTEAFAEFNLMPEDWIIVLGVSNGNLNQSVNVPEDQDNKPSLYGKLGWDSQINDDLRIRITGSFLNSPGYYNGGNLYAGDRAGARYYHVMEAKGTNDDFRSGRFSPGFKKFSSFQVNPFLKYNGWEFFGIYEITMGDKADSETKNTDGYLVSKDGSYTQLGAEVLYRFGSWDQFYLGLRLNKVSGAGSEAEEEVNSITGLDSKIDINRFNVGFGWFMTKNVMAKLEYVDQYYGGNGYNDGSNTGNAPNARFNNGHFNGVMFEAVIAF